MKFSIIAGLVLVTVVSFTGLGFFEKSMWIAFAVMAVLEVTVAFLLFGSRWRNRWAAVFVSVLAVFQIGQSYYWEQVRYTSSDSVIPIENFGVLLLCAIAIFLIVTGPSWPVDVETRI
ncbi:hypothetical protein [Rhodococcus sp. H29-C3]|uniref:hypothetical protein n=1 Tax=Rhodococcus sp. H29-C3 TaxID=3046307 RepID=UPI0024BB2BEA|nr:hypothetical protein [Rhodococcus sp. H29-C3]MDJ0361030.1 hypothetical protein [Rhodococcus sp. H29-C3]